MERLLNLALELDLAPWSEGLHALGEALDDQLEATVREVTEVIATEARNDHPYTDQTGELTRRTRAYAPRGSFMRDTLRGEVIANADYATFVAQRRGDWLERSLERSEGRIDHHLHDAVESAVRASGLG